MTPVAPPSSIDNAARLRRLQELAEECGAPAAAREAWQLAEQAAAGLFFVVCVGQFKRGKSTLLNALAGVRLLPSGVAPVTAIPTVVRYGKTERARLLRSAGGWEEIPLARVEDFVSQEHNPDNAQGVEGIEIFTPSPLLASGLCLVDTPGLGSVFGANTAAAHAFVPRADAGLVVLGADPPVTGAELDMIAELAREAPDLLFVLNKSDRSSQDERAAASTFTRRVLERRLGRPIGPLYEVSALRQAEEGRPSEAWRSLVEALTNLAAGSGRRLRMAGVERGARRIAQTCLRAVQEEVEALRRPGQESEARITRLRQTAAAAERSLSDLGALFAAEQARLSLRFAQRRRTALPGLHRAAAKDLALALDQLPHRFGPAFRRAAWAEAQEISHRHLLPWLTASQTEAEAAFAEANRRFMDLARNFLVQAADSGLDPIVADSLGEEGFRAPSRFYFCDFITRAQPASPLRYLADAFLGALRLFAPIKAGARRFLALLLDTNTRRVQSDLDERVAESRRRLEADIRALLHGIALAAQGALDRARATQAEGAAAVTAALDRLAALEHEIEREIQALAAPETTPL